MSTPRVVIKHIERRSADGYSDFNHEVEVYYDGEKIASGHYGGEPEDNSHYRTYSWVEPMLAKLAKAIGVEVDYGNEVIVEKE